MISGNDAAVALAEHIGGNIENFSNLMNEKAVSLGLTSSHFISPHGLDHEEHYTTAFELAQITDYALQNSVFNKIVNTHTYTITINDSPKDLHNTNELLDLVDGVYGVKTGFTNGANRCLVSACKRNNIDIICIVLGCDTKKDRTSDSMELINYIFDNFEAIDLIQIIKKEFNSWKENNLKQIKINKSMTNNLDLYIDTSEIINPNYLILKNTSEKIQIQIEPISILNAPIDTNSIIGKINVYYNTETTNNNYNSDVSSIDSINANLILSVNIKNKNKILKKDINYYMHSFLSNYFSYFSNAVNRYITS